MIDSIKQILNNDYFESNLDVVEIEEKDANATINKVAFINADEFLGISIDLISFLDPTFSDNKLCDSNKYPFCDELTFGQKGDGVFLAKVNNNWHLCACEIKSKLGQQNFFKAKAQLEVTVLKTLLLLKVVESFKNIKITCFIISSEVENATFEKHKQIRHRNISSKSSGQIAYQKFILTKSLNIKKDFCILRSFPIKDEYLLENSNIFFIEGNNKNIDILNYLE